MNRRFWDKVRVVGPNECWEWQACCDQGYGCFGLKNSFDKKWYRVLAHRFAWECFNGPIPNGICICHHCDNPKCCNPVHLFAGTLADNSHDMVIKGRNRIPHPGANFKGDKGPNHKLIQENVNGIRYLLNEGSMNQQQIADIYGVTQTTISKIKLRKRWIHGL